MRLNRCAYVLLMIFAGTVVGANLPDTAKFMPDRTVVLVNVEDFSECQEQFRKTSLYGLYTDPSMQEFVADTKRRLKEFLRSSEDETIRTIAAIDGFPSGKVVIAFVLPKEGSEAGKDPTMLSVSQWGDKTGDVKEVVEKMVQKAIEDGAKRSRQDYRGVNITTIKTVRESSVETDSGDSQENGGQAEMPVDELSYCFMDDALIVAEKIDSIEFVIAHIRGSSGGTLAEDRDYISAMKAVGPYHDIDVYVNIKKLISSFSAEDSTGGRQNLFKSLGLDSLGGYSFSLGIAREPGSNYFGKMVVKVKGEKRGIMKMLDLISSACKEPKFIGTKASSVAFINLDLNKAYDELFRILAQYQPAFAGGLNAPITPPTPDGKAGVTLKEGVLNHLGSEIVVCEFLDEPDTDDESIGGNMLMSISVKNSEKLEETTSQLHSMFTGPDTADAKREFMGHTIYLIKIPGLTAPPGPEIDSGDNQIQGGVMFASGDVPAFTITDTAILIGNESSVEQAIRILNDPSSESIGSVQWYRRARALVPQMVGIASFSDDATQVEQFWKMFKKGFSGDGQSDNPISSGIVTFDVEGAALGEFGEIIDASTLPEFEKVRKYFGVSAFYGLSRQDGFYFEFRDLTDSDLSSGR